MSRLHARKGLVLITNTNRQTQKHGGRQSPNRIAFSGHRILNSHHARGECNIIRRHRVLSRARDLTGLLEVQFL